MSFKQDCLVESLDFDEVHHHHNNNDKVATTTTNIATGKRQDLHVTTSDGRHMVVKSNLVTHLERLSVAHSPECSDTESGSLTNPLPIKIHSSDLASILSITTEYDKSIQNEELLWQSSVDKMRSKITQVELERKPVVETLASVRHQWCNNNDSLQALHRGEILPRGAMSQLLNDQEAFNKKESYLVQKCGWLSNELKTLQIQLSMTLDTQPMPHNVYLPGISTPASSQETLSPGDTYMKQFHMHHLKKKYPMRFPEINDKDRMHWNEDISKLLSLYVGESYLGFPWLHNVLHEKIIRQLGQTFNNWLDVYHFNDPNSWSIDKPKLMMKPVDLDPIIRFCGITGASVLLSGGDKDKNGGAQIFQSLQYFPSSYSDSKMDASVMNEFRTKTIAMLQCSTGVDKHLLSTLVNDTRFPVIEISTLFECALMQGFSVTGARLEDAIWITQEPYLSWVLSIISRSEKVFNSAAAEMAFERILPTYRQILWDGRRREQLASALGIHDPVQLVAFKQAQSMKRFKVWCNSAKNGQSLSDFEASIQQQASTTIVASPDLRSEQEIVAALRELRLKQVEAEAARRLENRKKKVLEVAKAKIKTKTK